MEGYGKDSAPAPAPEPAPAQESAPASAPIKKKRPAVKMTDKQKGDLTRHMNKMKKAGMSPAERKSHRMRMMGRMRKGMSVNKAHKDISK